MIEPGGLAAPIETAGSPEPPALRRSRWGIFSGGLFFTVAFFLPFVEGCVPRGYVEDLITNAGTNHVFHSLDSSFNFFSHLGAFLFPYLHGFCIALCALLAWRARTTVLTNVLLALACVSVALDSIAQFQWYCDIDMNIIVAQFTLTPHNMGPLFMLGWLIVGLQILTVKNAKDGRAKILWAATTALLPNFVWHAHFAGRGDTTLAIGWFLGVAATLLYLLCAIFGLRALRKHTERTQT